MQTKLGRHDYIGLDENTLNRETHDPRDPQPWYALFLDQSIPMNEEAKRALIMDSRSNSRIFLYPISRVIGCLSVLLIKVLKLTILNQLNSSKALHHFLAWGLKKWVRPEANFLILRHFHIGSEILECLAENIKGVQLELKPLRPKNLDCVKDDLFLNHDLNIYNFIIDLNKQLKSKNLQLEPKDKLTFNCITDGPFAIEDMPNEWTNFVDLYSAIELFTPIYQLFLTDNDFARASYSLQLDETISIYYARILKDANHLFMLNNKHPLVPDIFIGTGYRLMLHGLFAEQAHARLVELKRLSQRT
jgi:hypothetical protein